MVVVRDISEKTGGTYGALNHEIIERAEDFEECHYMHEGRNCNHGAHNLEKFALSLDVMFGLE